ncbi:MAG: hypothetical protein M0Z81_01025 [Deltaproteobacteria bacterium]|jgi:hypothetical protein|nr:hypothetical protein [Deltaproteobacteria bacterium]
MLKYPFEATSEEIRYNPDLFVSSVFSCLESEFLVMPKGIGFIEYDTFESGYEAIKKALTGFSAVSAEAVYRTALAVPVSVIVLRSMLGFTPSEWAYITKQRTGAEVTQGFARTLDRKIRMAPTAPLKVRGETAVRLKALIEAACQLLTEGAPGVEDRKIHRLDKADTKLGIQTLQNMAAMGAPYAMLLYERFLGRPFSSHRDSISELVGDSLESAVEGVLSKAGVSYRKTKRAERIEGFDQAPDFIVPSEFNPQVVIEAKLTEDDGTARDKVTRIQHLRAISIAGRPNDRPRFEVIACIGGRGFGVRREDMRKMLLATEGKVFTLKTLDRLIEYSRLKDFQTKHFER